MGAKDRKLKFYHKMDEQGEKDMKNGVSLTIERVGKNRAFIMIEEGEVVISNSRLFSYQITRDEILYYLIEDNYCIIFIGLTS